jgi:hypothetical protein
MRALGQCGPHSYAPHIIRALGTPLHCGLNPLRASRARALVGALAKMPCQLAVLGSLIILNVMLYVYDRQHNGI